MRVFPVPTEKECIKCGQVKDISEFYRRKNRSNRPCSACKLCSGKMCQDWQLRNPEYASSWYSRHKERYQRQVRERYFNDPEYVLRWRKENPEKAKAQDQRSRLKKKGDLKNRLYYSVISEMRKSLKKGTKAGRKWESLVGYTMGELRKHLEKQFKNGMTWENYGRKGWHIDHKIPISAFNYSTPDDIDFKRCWALKNLQPLEARKNLSKGAKLAKPFQPSLAIQIKVQS